MSHYGYLVHSELYYHGIKGQKWGIRRYQNPDGSLTEAGKKRYLNSNGYSLSNLNNKAYRKIGGIDTDKYFEYREKEFAEAKRKLSLKGNQLAKKSNFSIPNAAKNVIKDLNSYRDDEKIFSWEDAEEELLRTYDGYFENEEIQAPLMSALIDELKKKGYKLID